MGHGSWSHSSSLSNCLFIVYCATLYYPVSGAGGEVRRQSWDEARCRAATRNRERRMSSCISDAAGMVTAWSINLGCAFSNGWQQGGPRPTPAVTSLGTHIHIREGWLLLQEQGSGLTCALDSWSSGRCGWGSFSAG